MRKIMRDVLVEELPGSFVKSIMDDIRRAYREAAVHWEDSPLLGDAERRNIAPHLRRGLIETKFRERALDSGLIATVEKTATQSVEYTVVKAGIVDLTISKTGGKSCLPDTCDFRNQRSDANDMLHQQQLFPMSVDQPKDQDNANSVYAIITHGPAPHSSSEVGFINIGFPNPELNGWAEPPIELVSVYDLIVSAEAARDDIHESIQQVEPTLKVTIRNDNADEVG